MNHRDKEALNAYKIKDYLTAIKIWEEEAKCQNHQAMANLGIVYLKGEGVPKDLAKAKYWFEEASKYDNDSANYNLALMYQTKIGVEEDVPKAIEYFRRAVKQNHTGANFRLGILLLQDRTNPEQVKEGFNCMLTAGKNGHPMARAQIGGIDKPIKKTTDLNEDFRFKSNKIQLEIIEDALSRYVRPMLIQDGGNIMMIDYIEEPMEIRLAYQGNCAGCSMASTTTYELIQDTMTQVIDEGIRLYII